MSDDLSGMDDPCPLSQSASTNLLNLIETSPPEYASCSRRAVASCVESPAIRHCITARSDLDWTIAVFQAFEIGSVSSVGFSHPPGFKFDQFKMLTLYKVYWCGLTASVSTAFHAGAPITRVFRMS